MNLNIFHRYIFVFLISLFVLTGCGNSNKTNSKVQHNEANLPTIALAKRFVTNNAYKVDASDIESIKSGPLKLLYAYYTANMKTADGLLRWYISATGGSLSGHIFSLGDIETINGVEKVSWREVSSNAASVDLVAEQVNIANIADNYSYTFKDWGLGVNKTDESIQEDIELIRHSTVDVKWWFFQATNGSWYIIDTQNHIYKFGTKNGEYDWEQVDTTTFEMQFYMENGVKKIKAPISDVETVILPNQAVDTVSNPITRTYGNYTFEVRTDGIAPTEATQNAVIFFGKTSLTGLADSDTITFALHGEYASGTHFQLIIKNTNGDIVTTSEVVTFTVGDASLGFGVLSVGQGE